MSYKSESNLSLEAPFAVKKQNQERLYLTISVPMLCPCCLVKTSLSGHYQSKDTSLEKPLSLNP